VGIAGLAALALHAVSDSQPEPGPLSPVVCFADTRRHSVFVQEFDSQARAKSSVSDIPLDQLSGWLDKIYERNEKTPVYLSGLTDQISDHVRRHKGLICLKQPVNAAMIARYAVLSLGAPADYPHTGFSPLYVVAPKLGPAKQNA
ncbi:MAG: hypothetical protein VXW11_04930, partial [Pseudomonadota bacterium]|nr:hypothetical protein [Pseudomonadota bacterium]